jgi:hypothetical protein
VVDSLSLSLSLSLYQKCTSNKITGGGAKTRRRKRRKMQASALLDACCAYLFDVLVLPERKNAAPRWYCIYMRFFLKSSFFIFSSSS